MYNTDQYLRMIEKFNRMTFEQQIDTVKNNPNVLKMHLVIDIKGITPEAKEEIKKQNWFTINNEKI